MTVAQGTIIDSTGTAKTGLALRIQSFSGAGEAQTRAEGVTDAKGSFTLELKPIADALTVQARLRLLAVPADRPDGVALSDAPERYDAKIVDFGAVIFAGRAIGRIGAVDIYGVSKSLSDAALALVPPPERPPVALPDITTLQLRLAAAQRRIDEVDAAVPITDLLTSVGTQRDTADAALQARGVKIGNLSLEVKVLTPESGKVKMLGVDDISRVGDQASTLRFDVNRASPGSLPAGAQATVPDVRGYTEGLARRKMQASGLRVDTAFEPAPAEQSVGRVVTQIPGAGQVVAHGDLIRLFVGKKMT